MTLVGFRIDDRLLHGQVVENWIEALRPDVIVVASDRVAGDAFTRELYAAALPPGIRLVVAPIPAAAAAARDSTERVLLITGSAGDALALVGAGVAVSAVTVGGVHHAGGKERILDFVYLDDDDREALRRLHAAGIALVAQDVPRRRPADLAPLLGLAPASSND